MMERLQDEFSRLPLWQWVILAIILLFQGTWLFHDAEKRNTNRWLWGVWGLFSFPTPLVVYLLLIRKIWKRKSE